MLTTALRAPKTDFAGDSTMTTLASRDLQQ